MTIKIQVGSDESGIRIVRNAAGDTIGGTVLHGLSENMVIVVLDEELDGVIEALQQVKAHVEESK